MVKETRVIRGSNETLGVRPKGALVAVALIALALGGCSSMAKSLGISKMPPDEFTVISKAPLVVPPDYNLRPPDPDIPRAKNVNTEAMAFRALFPKGGKMPPRSPGETALLKSAGGLRANPDIRHSLGLNDIPAVRKGAFTRDILYGQPSGTVDIPIERAAPTPVGG